MPRRYWLARAFLCAAFTTLASAPALATQVLYMSTADLGSQSEVVVRGHVGDVRSYWNEDRTRILTEVEVQVDEPYKGAPSARVQIVQMGGVVDGVRMTVHGLPDWQRDEEVLVFLEQSLPGKFRVSGFSQGKFDLQRDSQSGELFVTRPTLGAEAVDGAGKRVQPRAVRLRLNDLLAEALPEFQEGR